MTILLIEDDYLTADDLVIELKTKFPAYHVVHVSTESDFREKLGDIIKMDPAVIIMDVMIRWTDPKEEMPSPPEEIRESGPWRAGLRCAELLHSRNPKIPVVLYSVLESEDLKEAMPPNVRHLVKSPSPAGLISELKSLGLR